MDLGVARIKKKSLIIFLLIIGVGLLVNFNVSSAASIQDTELTLNTSSTLNNTNDQVVTPKTLKASNLVSKTVGESPAYQSAGDADVSVRSSASNSSPNYLRNVVLVVIVKNNGPNNVSNINLALKLNKTYLKWISDDSKGLYNPNTGIWSINNLTTGNRTVLHVVEQVLTYDRTVTVMSNFTSGSFTDTDPTNNFSILNLTIPRASDLKVTQSTAKYNVKYLHTFVVAVTVKNSGPSTAKNVVVNCGLDPNVYAPVSYSQNRSYNPSTGNWTVAYLKSGSSITLHIFVRMLAFNSVVSNMVAVSSDTYDFNKSQNRAKMLITTPALTVNSLASSLKIGTSSRYQQAVNIVNWVRDNIVYSFYYNTKYGASGTLQRLKGNCADTAHLVVALARVSGFSARYKHGTCHFIESGHWYGHVWANIYVNGKWYSADATGYKNTLGVIKNWDTSTFTLHGTYNTLPF
ncbi:transglutaminase domain-containing protein [Methanobacterium lacus]|uniref:Transglutaminase domain-containing protein n=1 Tax=Methanobacterium lacus (strain AL-21) TaxID=877455 RepID=F0TC24_METLA|nr:transglutaminase domain-containing protein [Methanobacterium lacus]ADZ09175.1 transglutaminase domain-containing protein [Methanobacterium lacus]